MEEELNYLSEKIEELEELKPRYQNESDQGVNAEYNDNVIDHISKELDLLNNILNALKRLK